jgi:hypothetical protein
MPALRAVALAASLTILSPLTLVKIELAICGVRLLRRPRVAVVACRPWARDPGGRCDHHGHEVGVRRLIVKVVL